MSQATQFNLVKPDTLRPEQQQKNNKSTKQSICLIYLFISLLSCTLYMKTIYKKQTFWRQIDKIFDKKVFVKRCVR